MNFFITTLWEAPTLFFMQVFVVVFSVCCHEYSHAKVALMQGDPTAANRGHLTLNPMKQMGPYSLVLLAFMGIAWGQVPVNRALFRHKYSDALVSFAGPAMNLILFFAFIALFVFCGQGLDPASAEGFFTDPSMRWYVILNEPILGVMYLGATLNLVLFILNMLPVPILDGWGVFSYFFPQMRKGNSEFFNGLTAFICLMALVGMKYLFRFSDFIFDICAGPILTGGVL